jgi:hypothetical protein
VPFATLHGITLPIARNEWRLTPVLVGSADTRADSGELGGAETARKREWACSTPVGNQAEREALRRLMEGDGLHVDFDDASGFSRTGIGPATATSVTYSASGGKRGGRVSVGSTGALVYALAKKMRQPDGDWSAAKGWTVAVFKQLSMGDGGDGTTYFDHLATGNVVVTRGASANPAGVTQYRDGVAGSWNMGNWLSVSAAGEVGIHGYTNSGGGLAYLYDELLVLPFALPTALMATWAAALATFRASYACGALPRVKLAGDCIPDAQPLEVRIRQDRQELEQMAFEGAWHNNSVRDEYTVRQV